MTGVSAAAVVLGELAQVEVPLGPLTTYRVGGAARLFMRIEEETHLTTLREAIAVSGVEVLVVGKGSNLLVADRGFEGLAVVLGDCFAGIEVDQTDVRAGAAAALPVVARHTVAAGLTGFEWAVGVPGSVGGAVRMNAGGHGSDMARSLERVRVLDLHNGEDREVPASSLTMSYRHSSLAPHQLVLRADLALGRGTRSDSEALMGEIIRWRRDNQPGGPNAGSVFTNPPQDSAGRVVDGCGLKGLRVGTAEVSAKHANFIQADPGGSADDVMALMREVQRRVRDTTGIELVPETRVVGFEDSGTGEGEGAVGSDGGGS